MTDDTTTTNFDTVIAFNGFTNLELPTALNLSGDRVIFMGNYCTSNAGFLEIGERGIVAHNIFTACGSLADTAPTIRNGSDKQHTIIAGNQIHDAPYQGILVNAPDSIVGANIINNSADSSLRLGSGADRSRILSNIIDGGTEGIIATSGTTDIYLAGNDVRNASSANWTILETLTAAVDKSNYNGPNITHSATVASGAIVAPFQSGAIVVLDTEGAAASDDLDSITATYARVGQTLFLTIASASRIVTAKDGTNIRLAVDWVPNSTDDWLQLIYTPASRWEEVSRSLN